MTPNNQAAYLLKAGTPLELRNAPLPTAGPGELVVKNAAIAINPLDWHMADTGVFIQQWPAIFGCDVAGEVFEVGPGEERFKKGDRVIGHAINLTSGRPQDGAFALYTVIPATKAAILPTSISFIDGVVVPFAFEAALCVLSSKEPGVAMPGVSTPALGLPYPSLEAVPSLGKTLVVYGGSSSVGSMTTQLATAAGIHVISIAGKSNFGFSKRCGAIEVFDHKDLSVVEKTIEAVRKSGHVFIGIFDAIGSPETFANDLAILAALGGGHLACTHPPPADVPANVKAGMIFAVSDVATPVWKDYLTPALETGKLQCLPHPTVVGKGLEHIQSALEKSKAGVSATKLVVEL
ncbi:putative zinc-binding alcohol dehydrogenase domain-containing protein cipB [Delitschia confertaspora ATCC 74209]|uniref:Zinc-binding alcohol dehydrogenase domain-containing protein cipB n=1 Tax=Delitschia confertaspora ATCC 74209 TaxID=1513339 RepID=A0A9P4MQ47_9PLEO|nr:putative zinc-binding alcohol dehydrogenase domain-containing protein cipB [Delitschia confertaspora ATCC 74209]